MINIEGVMTAMITPFTKEGDIYEEALRNMVDFQIEKGICSLWINGTYGSGPMMALEERKKATEIVVDEGKKSVPIISHVGTPDTHSAVNFAKHAEDVGSDGV